MKLKKIKLAGFKSFVDPTTLHFPSSLIGVIGPNGCGKSNVIDAVRWVMGESSAKNLRGDSLEDVIFNGSNARKPIGQASVELVFENTEGRLGGEFASYSEISVKRLLTRDGKSVYSLNGTKCRRKDVTDLFLGTGLGPRSYAIIEQGMISKLIEAKPDDLRIFLEEAAGISKYKERRRETENRIKSTRDNLSRINDIREELDKRLNVLKRQAKQAEKYKALREQEREQKAQLLAMRCQSYGVEASGFAQAITEKELALEEQTANITRVEAEIEKLRLNQVDANESFNKAQESYYTVGAEVARLDQSIEHAKEQKLQQQEDLVAAQSSWNEAQAHINIDETALAELSLQIEKLKPQLVEAQDQSKRLDEELSVAETSMSSWQKQWDEFNSVAAQQVQTAEVERTKLQHLEKHGKNLEERKQALLTKQQHLNSHELEQQVEPLQQALNSLEKKEQDLKSLFSQLNDEKNGLRHSTSEWVEKLETTQEKLHQTQGLLTSLTEMQKNALGDSRNVDQWKETHALTDKGLLIEGLEVQPGWERAVEQVLGDHLESSCFEQFDQLFSCVEDLGQDSFCAFNLSGPSDNRATGSLAEPLLSKVSSTFPIEPLLSGVYAVEDLSAASSLLGSLASHESIVTKNGFWFSSYWLKCADTADKKAGVLERSREIESLTLQQTNLNEEVVTLKKKIYEGRARLDELEQQHIDLQEAMQNSTRELSSCHSKLSSLNTQIGHITSQKVSIEEEVNGLEKKVNEDRAIVEETRANLHRVLAENESHQSARNELVSLRDKLTDQLRISRECAASEKERSSALAVQIDSLLAQSTATKERFARVQQQIIVLADQRQALEAALSEGDAPIDLLISQREERLGQHLECEEALKAARHTLETCDEGMRGQVDKQQQLSIVLSDIRSDLEKKRMDLEGVKARSQSVVEQLNEMGQDLETLLSSLTEELTEDQLQQALEQVGQRIQRLGAINLAAIDEYTEESERKTYLDAQNNDLTEALDVLEKAIRKIDGETRACFKETYDKVEASFRELFPKLFGGGQAYLELTGDDLLSTGVTVMARPPGKRNSSIHQLSGGEKALTAVALVFSLFKLNPAPFCMLDEVDAPLDDANVGRFCTIVEEMSKQVQFIFISHNKVTMEMGHQLTGVTMQEPGVSRLVAVDIDEAVQMVAS